MRNNFFLIILLLLFNSCSDQKKKISKITELDQNMELVSTYREAYEALQKNDTYYAAQKFLEAELLYPQSIWAAKSALMASYSYYLQNYYAESLINLERFIKTYPTEKKLILNISSGAANKAIASWSTYCATKSALDSLTAVIDEEKHQNLKILSISPGVVDTNMQEEIRNSDPKNFPLHQNFVDYYSKNELISPKLVAVKLLQIIEKRDDLEGIFLNFRDFA